MHLEGILQSGDVLVLLLEMAGEAIAKLCRRRQVPLPRRGYWARKEAGQNPPVPVLPEFVAPPPPPKRISAAEQRELDRQREAEERRLAIAAKHAGMPLVCFIDDVATMLCHFRWRLVYGFATQFRQNPKLPGFAAVRSDQTGKRGMGELEPPNWRP